MSKPKNEKIVSTLNDLIEICKDGQEGFQTASEGVTDTSLKSLFSQYSLQRGQFAGALQAEVSRLGGSPEKGGSVSGSIHRGWINLKSAVTGHDEAAIIAECERGEDSAKEAYEKALQETLPADIRSLVMQQFGEVKDAHNRIRTLEVRMGH
jgi:uncharacterized protein (TIGR02284 family)